MYIFILIWALFAISICENNAYYEEIIQNGTVKVRLRNSAAFLIFLPLLLWAGLRNGPGYVDTNAYIAMYRSSPGTFETLREYISNVPKDKGFHLYTGIMRLIFGPENFHPYLFVIALVHTVAVIKFYRNYSIDFGLSFFFFIASADFYGWMFNGIRQFMAVAIIYLAIADMLEKKYIRFFLIVVFASLFHQSALIMIPLALVANGKAWNKKTLLFIGIGVFAVFFTSRFTNILEETMESTVYAANVEEMKNTTGTNAFRVAFYSVPAIIAFFGKEKLAAADDPIVDISVNMSIVAAVLYLISMVTSGIMMGRLTIYASLFNYILIPLEIKYVFDNNKGIKLGFILTYCFYYFYLMHWYGRI